MWKKRKENSEAKLVGITLRKLMFFENSALVKLGTRSEQCADTIPRYRNDLECLNFDFFFSLCINLSLCDRIILTIGIVSRIYSSKMYHQYQIFEILLDQPDGRFLSSVFNISICVPR